MPFLFPFLLSPVTTIFRKPPVNWVSYDCSATIVFPFKFLFKSFGHLGKRRKRQQENQILYIMNLWCFSILNYSYCWQYLVILYGLRGRKETFPIWWAAPNFPSSPFFFFSFFLANVCKLLNKTGIAHTHIFVSDDRWQPQKEPRSKNPPSFWGASNASREYFHIFGTSATRDGIYNTEDTSDSLGFRAQISLTGCG